MATTPASNLGLGIALVSWFRFGDLVADLATVFLQNQMAGQSADWIPSERYCFGPPLAWWLSPKLQRETLDFPSYAGANPACALLTLRSAYLPPLHVPIPPAMMSLLSFRVTVGKFRLGLSH
ncbi:hypothetical protein F5144DRAFT_545393 [Chaetomium tenue]|uniref:Uncharacterized protein n=1 Tax=Chaetomium tenue TaxID=1854479 RepID=A0ACB7PLT7_9PEZI|nr:hypothetical protein F5144DRAFT_545393 [Chaetomium globosum]